MLVYAAMFSTDAGWSHLLPSVQYRVARRHPHKLASTIAAHKQLGGIEASASLSETEKQTSKEKKTKISTKTRLQHSYFIFTTH